MRERRIKMRRTRVEKYWPRKTTVTVDGERVRDDAANDRLGFFRVIIRILPGPVRPPTPTRGTVYGGQSVMFEPIRGGTRGGQAEFKWSDVSADKDREVRISPDSFPLRYKPLAQELSRSQHQCPYRPVAEK